jgi:hypothetical protein
LWAISDEKAELHAKVFKLLREAALLSATLWQRASQTWRMWRRGHNQRFVVRGGQEVVLALVGLRTMTRGLGRARKRLLTVGGASELVRTRTGGAKKLFGRWRERHWPACELSLRGLLHASCPSELG